MIDFQLFKNADGYWTNEDLVEQMILTKIFLVFSFLITLKIIYQGPWMQNVSTFRMYERE